MFFPARHVGGAIKRISFSASVEIPPPGAITYCSRPDSGLPSHSFLIAGTASLPIEIKSISQVVTYWIFSRIEAVKGNLTKEISKTTNTTRKARVILKSKKLCISFKIDSGNRLSIDPPPLSVSSLPCHLDLSFQPEYSSSLLRKSEYGALFLFFLPANIFVSSQGMVCLYIYIPARCIYARIESYDAAYPR